MGRVKSGLETQALQDGGRLQLDGVAVAETEPILKIRIARQHRIVLGVGDGAVAQPAFQVVHLRLQGQQIAKRQRRFVKDRPPGVSEAVLREIADGQSGGLEGGPRVGFLESSHHLQERGLARAVRPTEADALPIRDLPGNVVEEDAIAERLRQL